MNRDFYLDVYTILYRIQFTKWTICAFRVLNPRQWSLAKPSNSKAIHTFFSTNISHFDKLTMVLYFLCWTMQIDLSPSPINHGLKVEWQLDKSHLQWLINSISLSAVFVGILIHNFPHINLEWSFWKHCEYKESVSYFWVHWKQIGERNKQIAQFVCPVFDSFPHELGNKTLIS